jgi:aquaporin Z
MIPNFLRPIIGMIRALREHWPEYLLEAIELGIFMISAGVFTALFEYPGSPIRQAIGDDFLRRMLIGLAMGSTAIGLIYSPLGQRSGAHMNPAVTLTFLRLGKVKPWDAVYYIVAQFVGGIAGISIVAVFIHQALAHPSVNYVVTAPGPAGEWIAFVAEFLIAFCLMLTLLFVSNTPRLARWTGVYAGCLVTIYIAFEAPFSGMSMNPARTFGSALTASFWTGLWIYFVAPILAMQLAAEVYVRFRRAIYCAKLHHYNHSRCIFNCSFGKLLELESK